MKNNLFWLLFGSTAIGLSLCGLALYFTILFAMAQDQVLDFADDVHMIREDIIEYCLTDADKLPTQSCIKQLAKQHDFDIQLSQFKSEIDEEEIGRVGDKRIYTLAAIEGGQAEGFQALMPLQVDGVDNGYWLVVRDDLEQLNNAVNYFDEDLDSEQYDEDGLDIALTGAIYGIFILLFILAIFLYFPVRKLNRWIGDIQHASEQIGKQNYDVRLAEYKIQPLGSLATSFNGMAERIQSHIRDKNILANAIAHELRTPLTRFRLALGLLNRQSLDGMAKELVDDLERYTDDLEMITDNTLRLATLRDSKMNLQTIKLAEFIDNLGDKFQSSFPELSISVISEVYDIETDMGFLQLALDNLLSNACHYAQNRVSLKQWHDSEKVYIEICDDGPGIAEKDVAYIQQAFTRLDKSRNRATGGVGLGLAIVRIAVQRLQGELIFQPAAQGTRIRLSLSLT